MGFQSLSADSVFVHIQGQNVETHVVLIKNAQFLKNKREIFKNVFLLFQNLLFFFSKKIANHAVVMI